MTVDKSTESTQLKARKDQKESSGKSYIGKKKQKKPDSPLLAMNRLEHEGKKKKEITVEFSTYSLSVLLKLVF